MNTSKTPGMFRILYNAIVRKAIAHEAVCFTCNMADSHEDAAPRCAVGQDIENLRLKHLADNAESADAQYVMGSLA
jgi:hypothetical protein